MKCHNSRESAGEVFLSVRASGLLHAEGRVSRVPCHLSRYEATGFELRQHKVSLPLRIVGGGVYVSEPSQRHGTQDCGRETARCKSSGSHMLAAPWFCFRAPLVRACLSSTSAMLQSRLDAIK